MTTRTVTVTFTEHEARALVASGTFADLVVDRLRGDSRRPWPPGECPREVALQKLLGALERSEVPA